MAESTQKGGKARRKKKPAARKSAPKPPPQQQPPPPGSEWGELADRAARKISEFAEKAKPHVETAAENAKKIAVDLTGGLDSALSRITEQARDLMAKGQHTRVRIKFRGKQIAELPIAAVAAAEVGAFVWLGPLQVVVGNLLGKAVLDVEFISNADHHVAQGKKFLAEGEIDKANAEFERALAIDRRNAGALLGKGVSLKLQGKRAEARDWFEKAEEADPRGDAGREARRHLDNL